MKVGKYMTYKAIKTRLYLFENEKKFLLYLIHEAYASKASFIDKDALEETAFSGKRIKRGLYRNKKGILINNDLNAVLNIIQKSKPNALEIGFKGWNTPKRTYLFG
ncbi:MAG TPA: hypothetical protein VJ878_00265 [Candidatus Izemoplasmatales bacterium]|nr:hypothetical protein [Candidatus Izemoplasmatales bacterium]